MNFHSYTFVKKKGRKEVDGDEVGKGDRNKEGKEKSVGREGNQARDERYIGNVEWIGDVLPWYGVLKGNTMEGELNHGRQPADV
jgi:hypothetical protein